MPIIFLPMARKMSLTFMAVFADVSIKSKLFSSAYACASCKKTSNKKLKAAIFSGLCIVKQCPAQFTLTLTDLTRN